VLVVAGGSDRFRRLLINVQDEEGMMVRSLMEIEVVEGKLTLDLDIEQVFTLKDLDVSEVEDHAKVAMFIHRSELEGAALIEEDVEGVRLITHVRKHIEVFPRNNGGGEASKVVGDAGCGSVHGGKQV